MMSATVSAARHDARHDARRDLCHDARRDVCVALCVTMHATTSAKHLFSELEPQARPRVVLLEVLLAQQTLVQHGGRPVRPRAADRRVRVVERRARELRLLRLGSPAP
jgi:hypothetical protein